MHLASPRRLPAATAERRASALTVVRTATLALLLLGPLAPRAATASAPSAVPTAAAIEAVLAAAPPAGGARAAAASAPLLGVRYLLSPLGEGRGEDPDPTFRLDAFDCVTFVETAMALGGAASLEEAGRALDEVRYAGAAVEIADRNHEVLSQWIPANLAKGRIAPLAREVGGGAAVVAATEYTPERWRRLRAAGQRLTGVPAGREPLGRFEVEVVPPAALLARADRIPDGTVAWVVRQEQAGSITRVSHGGLIVVRDGRRLVRHASSWPGVMKVVEEPLADFLRHQRQASHRPLTGLALFRILDGRAAPAAGGPPPDAPVPQPAPPHP